MPGGSARPARALSRPSSDRYGSDPKRVAQRNDVGLTAPSRFYACASSQRLAWRSRHTRPLRSLFARWGTLGRRRNKRSQHPEAAEQRQLPRRSDSRSPTARPRRGKRFCIGAGAERRFRASPCRGRPSSASRQEGAAAAERCVEMVRPLISHDVRLRTRVPHGICTAVATNVLGCGRHCTRSSARCRRVHFALFA